MPSNNDASTEMEFEYTGKGCVVPKDVTIVRFHPSVVEVENRAFSNCNNLNEVVLNDGLQKIGSYAFRKCASLSSVTLPSTVTEIGYWAFCDCKQLRVVFNDGLQKIGKFAFYGCTSLSSITLPSTVTEIANGAFQECRELSAVVFNDGLQRIGKWAFCICRSLSSIILTSTVFEIGSCAFSGCCLREVVFNGVPREIGGDAFRNSTSLERFTFPTISTRLDTLIQTGHWEEIENEINEVRGVVERSDELFVSTRTMGRGNDWMSWGRNYPRVRDDLNSIVRVISYYELKEATSMLELALWKFKLDQVDKANPIPRKKCRVDVPGPVKDIILQYLPYECILPVSDIQSSSSESDDVESSDGDYYESSDDDDYD